MLTVIAHFNFGHAGKASRNAQLNYRSASLTLSSNKQA